MKRLFFGFPISDELKQFVVKGISEHKEIKWIPEDNWHVTVLFLGNVEEGKMNEILEESPKFFQKKNPFLLIPEKIFLKKSHTNPMIWVGFKNNPDFENLVLETRIFQGNNEKKSPNPHVNLSRLKNKKILFTPIPIPEDQTKG